MLTLEDRDVKWFTWAVVLTSLGYLLLLLVSIFPFWVRLVKDESQEVFFSGLFENCFQIKCWKPRPLSIYIVLGRVFLLCAVLFSFLTVFAMVSFASDLFPGTWKHNLVSAFISFLTGACAFLALLLHALEMQSLRMKPNPPHFSVQWPYYALGFSILLFVAAVAARCRKFCRTVLLRGLSPAPTTPGLPLLRLLDFRTGPPSISTLPYTS